MTAIRDAEVQILAALATTLQADYAKDDLPWHGSPFAWIKTRKSRQVGAIGEKLVSGYFATKGFNVTRSSSTPGSSPTLRKCAVSRESTF